MSPITGSDKGGGAWKLPSPVLRTPYSPLTPALGTSSPGLGRSAVLGIQPKSSCIVRPSESPTLGCADRAVALALAGLLWGLALVHSHRVSALQRFNLGLPPARLAGLVLFHNVSLSPLSHHLRLGHPVISCQRTQSSDFFHFFSFGFLFGFSQLSGNPPLPRHMPPPHTGNVVRLTDARLGCCTTGNIHTSSPPAADARLPANLPWHLVSHIAHIGAWLSQFRWSVSALLYGILVSHHLVATNTPFLYFAIHVSHAGLAQGTPATPATQAHVRLTFLPAISAAVKWGPNALPEMLLSVTP